MATASLPNVSTEMPFSETSSFIYATQYNFLPLGVKKIQEVFGKSLAKENLGAQCDYMCTGHSFLITCTSIEFNAVVDQFHKIVNQIIEEEIGYDDGYGDEIDSKLIARVHFNSDFEETPEPTGAHIAGRTQSGDFLASWDEWHCQSENQIMDTIIPRAAQEQIESLTGTKLIADLNLQVIHVGSESKEVGERALHKLDILRKSFDIAQRPGAHHVFYGEQRENFRVSLKQIVQIPKKLTKTTLLDPFRNQNYALRDRDVQRICTIRFCYFDPDRSTYLLKAGAQLFPLVQAKDKNIEFEPWKNYTYPAMGTKPPTKMQGLTFADVIDDEIPIHPLELKQREEKVKKWLADDTVLDAVEQIDLSKVEEGKIDHELNDREERAKKWLADDNSSASTKPEERIKLDLLDLDEPTIDRHMMNNSTPLNKPELLAFNDPGDKELNLSLNLIDSSPMQFSGHHLGNNASLRQIFSAPETSHAETLDGSKDLCDLTNLHRSSKSVLIPSSSIDNGNLINNQTNSTSLDDIWPEALTDIGNSQHVLTTVEVMQPGNLAENLICHEVPHNAADILEVVETNSEMDSRTYHSTMRQGAPKRGKRIAPRGKSNLNPAATSFKPEARKAVIQEPIDPTEEFGKVTSEKIKLLLTSMRIWQGEVLLEAQFGRIILRNLADNAVAWGSTQLSHTLGDMDWILSFPSNMIDFTRILTTVGADAQWVVNLKNASNESMWKNVPRCSVTYEFECYDEESSTWFMVEIDAATSKTKVKSLPKEIGTVLVHCTLRNWDYRLAAIGSKNLEEEYGHIASEISKSIYIKPDLEKMTMHFELDTAHGVIFNFVRVLRTALYPSTGNGSQLKITEVHDLKFDKCAGGNVYCAYEGESATNEGMPTTWYQIGLTSPIAERVLAENVNLEFGEETTWSEEVFDERVHVFRSLCLPACYMARKMDGMGFYNDNGYVAPAVGPAPSVVAQTVASGAAQLDGLYIPPDDPAQW